MTDVLLLRAGETARPYGGDNAASRAMALRTAFAESLPGDHICVGPGLFDFGYEQGNVIFPDKVTIQGFGMHATKLKSRVWSDKQGTAFVLQNNVVSDLSLENETYQVNEDGRTVGYDPLPSQTLPFSSRIERCMLVGNAWTVYNWNNLGNYLLLKDCYIKFGRQGVSAMGSGGGASQYVDIVRCSFVGDASRSEDVGATSHQAYGGVFGVCARGGIVKIIDCDMNLKGRLSTAPSYLARVCGVIDTFEAGPSPQTLIEIMNLRCKINPNGTVVENCFDIDVRNPTVNANMKRQGGWGSGVNGAFLVKAP